MMDTVSKEIFRAALSQLAAGVSIVTTALNDDRRGVTATAVCSVSAEPAMVLACINRNTGTFKMISDIRLFAVNFVSQRHFGVAEVFAGRTGVQGESRFDPEDWTFGSRLQVPVLQGAATTLECEVHQIVDAGTHGVVIGLVQHASVVNIDPLLYHGGRFCSLYQDSAHAAS
jgi:flavin reductase (DIM6/NTAB) family NADH-FMN oxidoreductase RutF